MKKNLIIIVLILLCFSSIAFIGCGDNTRVVANEYISFALERNFDYAFHDVKQDQPGFPLGDQLRIVIWEKEFPNNWSIFIFYPCPPDVSDLMGDISTRTVNGVEVLQSKNSGFYLQAYLDPTMAVGISSTTDEVSIDEANRIVESLKVKKSSE